MNKAVCILEFIPIKFTLILRHPVNSLISSMIFIGIDHTSHLPLVVPWNKTEVESMKLLESKYSMAKNSREAEYIQKTKFALDFRQKRGVVRPFSSESILTRVWKVVDIRRRAVSSKRPITAMPSYILPDPKISKKVI